MNPGTDKRQGVVALQRHLGVTPAQTAVFGDYLNDLQMLDAGEWSFAMANAHPDLKRAARYIARPTPSTACCRWSAGWSEPAGERCHTPGRADRA